MSDEQPADQVDDVDVPAATSADEDQPDWAHSFGGVAEAYERGRPTYPVEAVRWLLGEAAVDAVIAAQAVHWFDLDRALPEVARVLKPGGHLCLVWNFRNEKIPWVRRLGGLIGTQDQQDDPAQGLIFSELFGFVEDKEFSHWQVIDRKSLQDLVLSRSNVAVLGQRERAAKLAED